MAKKSLKDVKVNNTAQVLECIIKNDQVSRIEISEKTKLSPSTVSQAVALLIEKGIAEEVCSGESTGGRKPILLRLNPGYGFFVTLEIKRSGVDAQIFNLRGALLGDQILEKRRLSGNDLLTLAETYIQSLEIDGGKIPGKLVGIGLLCQDDIPEYDLNVEFSTSFSSDVISLEKVLSTKFGVPVKKELINRYSLDYYLQSVDAKCTDYAYINIGERVTASFVLNRTLVHNTSDSVFDISSAVLSGNYAGTEGNQAREMARTQEISMRNLPIEKIADKLAEVLKNALLFFPVNDIFIGGQVENIEVVVNRVAKEFALHPVVRKAEAADRHVNHALAYRILTENYRLLVGMS